jgi:hypothetical protein
MSNSRIYNLTLADGEKLEESLTKNKFTYDYKVNLNEDHWIRFTNPPTQYEVAAARGRAKTNSSRLKTLNRLKDKIGQRKKALKIEPQETPI